MVLLKGRCMSTKCRVEKGKNEDGKMEYEHPVREFESNPETWSMIMSKKNNLPRNSYTALGKCSECGGNISCIVSGKSKPASEEKKA